MKDVVKSQTGAEYKYINGRRVKINRRRRRNNLTATCAVAVAIISAIGLVLCLCFLFRTNQVNIEGVTLYSNDQIMSAGGVLRGANLIRTNTDIIEKRLVETLPYIETAEVSKVYPDSLNIKITESQKYADIEKDGKYYTISDKGSILEEKKSEHDKSIPVVKGFGLNEEKLGKKIESKEKYKTKILLDIIESMKKIEFDDITEIDLTDRTNIIAVYDGRIKMEIGRSDDIENKLLYMKTVIDKKIEDDFKGILRYNGLNEGISAIPEKNKEKNEKTSEENKQSKNSKSVEYNGWENNTSGNTIADNKSDHKDDLNNEDMQNDIWQGQENNWDDEDIQDNTDTWQEENNNWNNENIQNNNRNNQNTQNNTWQGQENNWNNPNVQNNAW